MHAWDLLILILRRDTLVFLSSWYVRLNSSIVLICRNHIFWRQQDLAWREYSMVWHLDEEFPLISNIEVHRQSKGIFRDLVWQSLFLSIRYDHWHDSSCVSIINLNALFLSIYASKCEIYPSMYRMLPCKWPLDFLSRNGLNTMRSVRWTDGYELDRLIRHRTW